MKSLSEYMVESKLTTLKIGNKNIKVELLNDNKVIYLVKYQGKNKDFFTIISAKENTNERDLEDIVYMIDNNSEAFWSECSNECEFLNTKIPAFSQFNNPQNKYRQLIIDTFKF